MEDLSQEVVKLSKINSAGLINMRINNVWIEVNKAAISGNYFRWNSNLDRIWCELGGDIKKSKENKKGELKEPEEITEFNKLDKEVSDKLKELPTIQGFSKFTEDDKKIMSELYKSLLKKEFFLRRLMNEQGKGTAYQEDADWD